MRTRLTFFCAPRRVLFASMSLKSTWAGKAAAVVAVLLCAVSGFASNLQVTLSSEGLTLPFGDSGNGYTVLSGAIPHWSFPAGIVCTSQPYVGTANSNCVSVWIPYFEDNGSLEPLNITATEIGLDANPTADTMTMILTVSPFSCTQTGILNGVTIGSNGTASGTESYVVSGPTSGFSLTESLAVLSDTPYASGSLRAQIFLYHNPIPEPSAAWLLGLGLAGWLTTRRTRSQRQPGRETLVAHPR